MRISEIMTREAVWCEAGEMVETAARIMREKNAGIVPVLENADTRQVIGVVTDRDLALRVIAEGLDPRFVSVQEVMTRRVASVRPTCTAERALAVMKANRIRRIPVTDGKGRLRGMISLTDIVRSGAAKPAALFEVLKALTPPRKEKGAVKARMAAA